MTAIENRAGIAVYAPVFFNSYAPTTALDMVSRVPGFSLSNGDRGRRGLGDSFGNLLINGQRPSNKSLSLQTVLQRIPVADVQRIELIQEALPEYEMRGHSRLVNVILREGAGRSGSWTGRVMLSDSGRVGTRHEGSYTFPVGSAEIILGIDTGFSGNRLNRREARYDGGGALTRSSSDSDQRNYAEIVPTATVNWTVDDRSSLRLDTRAEAWTWNRQQVSFTDDAAGDPLLFERSQTENHGSAWSATGTYHRDWTDTISTESILLARRERWEDGPEPFERYDPQAGFIGATIVEFEGQYEETAFRQTLSWDPDDRHSFEIGAETALNARDTDFALSEDDGATITPIPLPVSTTRVEETRSEVFANHVWSLNDQLSLESGLRYEFSEITQTGDANQSRSFTYAKPSVTLNWRRNAENRFRITAERDVDQLEFSKFASSVDVADNNSTLGNPDYVPQRTWTVEAEWERRFGDDGSFSLQVGYDWIQDLDGWIPVVTPDGVFDAPGNIGDGTNLRVTGNLTTPLDQLGLSNAVIDVFLEWYDTNVEDPLTGADRHWSGVREWELRLDYRQTFPEQQFAWGWDYFWLSDGNAYFAQRQETYDNTDGDLDIYVETTRWFGATIRAGMDAVLNTGDQRTRAFYDGSRANGVILATEHRNVSMGRTGYIRIVNTF
ncbi:TonB-dependent receptor [Maricaulis sp.]|uniref:TonB-dependent receptor plug domain-containing protein n=1 Tax=Maricaulis sp. TaxID=1486257 RepID=UPI002603AE96|nr:TonB-dependent receptor [Maricaulis sp.]